LVYGEAGTGKTTLALQCAVVSAKMNFRVLFIDADRTFPAERLKQMVQNGLEETSSLIEIITPNNFFEQALLIERLDRLINENVGLVAVDTVNSLYRLAATNPDQVFTLNKELNRQQAYLTHFAKTCNIPVMLTSQVHSVFEEGLEAGKIEPVATRALRFWSSNILHLKQTQKPGMKIAYLEKFGGKNVSHLSCHFSLFDRGLE